MTGVDQVRVLFGEAVAHLVGGDIQAHQRVKGAGAVAEGHGGAVPEGVLVVVAVVDAHGQLKGQGRHAQPGVVHVVDHAAEEVGVVQGAVGAVDLLEGVFRTRVAVGR